MFVSTYVRMYVCTYLCMYVCKYVCTYVCIYLGHDKPELWRLPVAMEICPQNVHKYISTLALNENIFTNQRSYSYTCVYKDNYLAYYNCAVRFC